MQARPLELISGKYILLHAPSTGLKSMDTSIRRFLRAPHIMLDLQVESFMISQASPTSANRRSRRAYAPRADFTRDRCRSSCSKSPPPRFRASNGSPKRSLRPLTEAKSTQGRLLRDGAHNKSACPSCLGRHPHNINNCITQYLWDGTPAHARRTPEGRLIDPAGDILCHDWQKPQGCSRPHNNAKHACSGCGSTSHGAQKCPKGEPRSGSNAI